MAFKYTCVILLLSLAVLSAQGKLAKKLKDKSKPHKDDVLRKVHDTIKFKGNDYNCDHFHTTNNFGTWCGCPFLACTGGQDCYGTYHCYIKNHSYDYRDMKDEDCDCDHHRK